MLNEPNRAERMMGSDRSLGPALVLVLLAVAAAAKTPSVCEMMRDGNRLYEDGQHTKAINKYNEVLVERPDAAEPKFNKANSYYRLDDLGEAMDLYQEVAAGSTDITLVTRAKYNLGNCFFQRGCKQRDSDLQKALEDLKTSITYWRQVLDLDPKNEKAARNIEVARLTIKDILDQLKQQQKDQQGQQQQQSPRQQDQSPPPQDPNQPQEPNQPPPPSQSPDPNQAQDKQPEPQPQEREIVPDATAQEILDNEQRQKKEREILQRGQYQEVEKDW